MTNKSGLADSPFFSGNVEPVPTPPLERPAEMEATTPPPDSLPPSMDSGQAMEHVHRVTTPAKKKKAVSKQSRNRDVMTSRNHDTVTSLHRDITLSCSQEMIAKLRGAVKQIGKEPTTCRLTLEEKRLLKAVEFEYSTKDIQTSANEILRIAMNVVIGDYKENGEASLLDIILKALKE